MPMPENILWDWNGTLLDDTDICLEGINRLLARRQLGLIDKHRYREIFTFPVRDYYKAAGFCFSKEPFEVPAEEFIVEYKQLLAKSGLFADVSRVLSWFEQAGTKQYIVSAMEQQALERSVSERGISHFFHRICGIENNLAFSKVYRGLELIETCKLDITKTIMVGDTLHDHEVAAELGVRIILVGRGHQSQRRLEQTGNTVLSDLEQLIAYLSDQKGERKPID
jgi:phosphoglycolate phosphatase